MRSRGSKSSLQQFCCCLFCEPTTVRLCIHCEKQLVRHGKVVFFCVGFCCHWSKNSSAVYVLDLAAQVFCKSLFFICRRPLSGVLTMETPATQVLQRETNPGYNRQWKIVWWINNSLFILMGEKTYAVGTRFHGHCSTCSLYYNLIV